MAADRDTYDDARADTADLQTFAYLERLTRAERSYAASYAHWLTMGAGADAATAQAESGRTIRPSRAAAIRRDLDGIWKGGK